MQALTWLLKKLGLIKPYKIKDGKIIVSYDIEQVGRSWSAYFEAESVKQHIQWLQDDTGMTLIDLERYAWYFQISLMDMRHYYMIMGRLPEPEYLTIIKHIGVDCLIDAITAGEPIEKPIKQL